jgi:hypothetical protein
MIFVEHQTCQVRIIINGIVYALEDLTHHSTFNTDMRCAPEASLIRNIGYAQKLNISQCRYLLSIPVVHRKFNA